MSDLSDYLRPWPYPERFAVVRESFAPQPDECTCGAAMVRHGLLLGGLVAPVGLLESLLEIRDKKYTEEKILLKCLNRLGFLTRSVKKAKKQKTAAFLDNLRPELEQGAFALPCLYEGGTAHWVCLGAWDGMRAWVIDSYYDRYWTPGGLSPCLDFFGYTEEEFDDQEWGNDIILVSPTDKWAKQYRAWLPARPALLRMPVKDGLASPMTVEAAVGTAAVHYLNDAEYSYRTLGLYLPGGVEVTVNVEDPGEDAVLVGEEGVGEERVLVVRRAKGAPRRRTPPELVLRAGQLRAAQLSCGPDE
jgi:hypothetical protein